MPVPSLLLRKLPPPPPPPPPPPSTVKLNATNIKRLIPNALAAPVPPAPSQIESATKITTTTLTALRQKQQQQQPKQKDPAQAQTQSAQQPQQKQSNAHPPPPPKPPIRRFILTPEKCLKLYKHKLTTFEQHEIKRYPFVYFLGHSKANKTVPNLNTPFNNGFDDEKGNYKFIKHDHIQYRYETIKILGKGTFGQVLKCFDHKKREFCAVKIVRNEQNFNRQAQEEIRILEQLKKQDTDDKMNIIHIYDSFTFRNHVCITFELLSVNLEELSEKKNYSGFAMNFVKKVAYSVLKCLEALEKNKLIHCDLKPENILLKEYGHSSVKVIDFGSSCHESERIYTYIQSRFYRAPEVILGTKYGMPIDMWSLGCIVAELLSGTPLFPGADEIDQLACIIELIGMPKNKTIRNLITNKGYPSKCSRYLRPDGKQALICSFQRWSQPRGMPATKTWSAALKNCEDKMCIDFVRRCLDWDPLTRMTPAMALRHPWLRPTPAKVIAARTSAATANATANAKANNPHAININLKPTQK